MLKIVINGCNGKMGQVLAKAAAEDPEIEVVAGIDKNIHEQNNNFPVYEKVDDIQEEADIIIDFSRPDSVLPLTEYAKKTNTALVVATTGLEDQHFKLLKEAAEKIPVFQSANMSLGVNVAKNLCSKATQVLGDNFDIEVVEFHHNRKVDAPSGTALLLADAINEQLAVKKEYVYGRTPQSGKRENSEIGIHAIRGGTMPGEHRVIFSGPDEIVEIRHLALSRTIFALGALKAAKFTAGQKNGLFNMDLLISQ